jgi:hypothetical protein
MPRLKKNISADAAAIPQMENDADFELLKVDSIRYAEYYDMIDTFDTLCRESMNGKIFDNLLPLITSRENILLAYRSMKTNKGKAMKRRLRFRDFWEARITERGLQEGLTLKKKAARPKLGLFPFLEFGAGSFSNAPNKY